MELGIKINIVLIRGGIRFVVGDYAGSSENGLSITVNNKIVFVPWHNIARIEEV